MGLKAKTAETNVFNGDVPPPPSYAEATATATASPVLARLQQTVRDNGWGTVYPPQTLQAIAQQITTQIDIPALARAWRITEAQVIALTSIALVDVVVVLDDSGSMSIDQERQDDMLAFLKLIGKVVTLFDADGISIATLNDQKSVDGISDPQALIAKFDSLRFQGCTPVGATLRRLHKTYTGGTKPVLAYIVFDGAPDSQSEVFSAIKSQASSSSQVGRKGWLYQFLQVGRDTSAQTFLSNLDNASDIGDLIDACSYIEAEQLECQQRKGTTLTVQDYIVKSLIGALDPSMDSKD